MPPEPARDDSEPVEARAADGLPVEAHAEAADGLPEPESPIDASAVGPPTAAPDDPEPIVPHRKGPKLTRRRLLGLIAGGMVAGAAYRFFVIDPPPSLATLKLSEDARELIRTCWEGLDPKKVVDVHVHVIGLGKGGTGCFVHEGATSMMSPMRYVKTRFYKGAAGIHDDERADQLFVKRLVDLCTHQVPRGRFLLLAFDKHYDTQGKFVREHTEFYTPNDYVAKLVKEHPELFLFCCSIHPYRADAVEALHRCKEQGAVAVKWLPNAMGIDPMDPRCDPFYEAMKKHGMTLLSHGGEEQAVHAEEAQELGNPLRLRRALDHGVKVITAHCASLGTSKDLDAADGGEATRVSSYELFRRVVTDERYRGLAYGGLSAMTQFNRCEDPLRETIASPELHGALVNGSDYPLPAIDPLVRTGLLESLGYITARERELINQIFSYNPLAFDFVLKRCLKVERDGKVHKLPDSAFETAHLFGGA